MQMTDLYKDWKEYAWNGWLRWRRGEGPAKGSAMRGFGFKEFQRSWFFEDLPKLRNPQWRRHESGGMTFTPPKGHYSRIDWDKTRADLGVAEGEKLYYGFVTKKPEVHVPDHHQRRRPGTPVYVDDEPLERRIWFDEGEIVTAEQRDSEIAAEADEEGNYQMHTTDGEETNVPAGVIKAMMRMGSSIYDRDASGGDEELALNILYDSHGSETALRFYRDFTADVVNKLAHERLEAVVNSLYANDAFDKYAEWYLKGSDIENWLDARR